MVLYDKQGSVPPVASTSDAIERRVEVPVLPVVYAEDPAFPRRPPLDIDPDLAARSQLDYDPRRFPARPGLRELLEGILVSEGVPGEIAVLPWVESDYNVECHSRAGAAGPWQFLRETARDLGLRMDSLVDERYSWTSATRAAARYLREMRGRLGDWTLAVAAYNCGEGAVASALADGCSDFDRMDLPGETEQFIPRFSAATLAYRRLEPSEAALSVIAVPPDLDLRVLAAAAGVPADSVVLLNRHYLREITPPDGQSWELVVPAELAPRLLETAWRLGDGRRYRVSPGDSWSSIAGMLGVSEDALRASNPDAEMIPGAFLELPATERRPVNLGYGGREDFIVYIVRTGDTLGAIGESVGVSSREVAEWNDMSPDDVIYPGQRLVLQAPGGSGQLPESLAARPGGGNAPPELVGGGRLEHVVQEGDTLWDIGLRYGVTVEQIMYLNSLESSILHPGDLLLIRTE